MKLTIPLPCVFVFPECVPYVELGGRCEGRPTLPSEYEMCAPNVTCMDLSGGQTADVSGTIILLPINCSLVYSLSLRIGCDDDCNRDDDMDGYFEY